ncbi:hypothetical protein HYQ46_002611 [Verticillium longisporum]|nr:hypothetical protein HYQ46_002611 [Verticillium longisporum]
MSRVSCRPHQPPQTPTALAVTLPTHFLHCIALVWAAVFVWWSVSKRTRGNDPNERQGEAKGRNRVEKTG